MSFKIEVDSRIKICDAPKEIVKWCKDNLVIENPDFDKKRRMNFWVGNTPRTISLFEEVHDKIEGGKNITTLFLPYGLLEYFSSYKDFIEYKIKPHKKILYKGGISLRPYQENALQAIFEAQNGILQSPAGSGKTQIGLALIEKYNTKALWITHTKDLLNQSKKRAESYIDKNLIGTITEGKINIGSAITFATVQTLINIDLEKYKDEWDVIIVDECHRASANAKSITMFQKVLNTLSCKHKYGLSATMHRSDGLIFTTIALIGGIKYTITKEEISEYLTPISVIKIDTDIGYDERMSNGDGTMNYSNMITYLCENEIRNQKIANDIIANSNNHCLVLSTRLKHLENLRSKLPKEIFDKSVFINGKMVSKKEKVKREQAIESMRNGSKNILFATYSLAKEGLDVPCLNRLFLVTPQKDYTVLTQSIGRIERKYAGKKESIVYDYVDETTFLMKNFKKRYAIYKKNGCTFT